MSQMHQVNKKHTRERNEVLKNALCKRSFPKRRNSGEDSKRPKFSKHGRNVDRRPNVKRPPILTKVLALDCEMVSDINDKNMLGRVSIVNYHLFCIYDKFVKPEIPVGDYRTRYSGIRESDLENGTDFRTVQEEVKLILRNKILVGHALKNDFDVLKFGHQYQLTRDTSKYKPFWSATNGNKPSLKKLAKVYLGEDIQQGEHSSVEDAKVAMKLYKKFRCEWEGSLIQKKT